MMRWLCLVLCFTPFLAYGCCPGRENIKKPVGPAFVTNAEYQKHLKQLKKESGTWTRIKKRWSPKHQETN